MSLIGKLQDLSAIDVLQILSLSKRTGVLTIDSAHGKSNILFKNGMIISASSPFVQSKNLGQTLIDRHLLSSSRLEQLLELQKQRGNEPLGSILLEAGVIQEEELREIIKNGIRETLHELKSLTEGHFSFQSTDVVPFDDLQLNPLESVSEDGWHPKHLLEESEEVRDAARRKSKTIPFQPVVLKARSPAAITQPLSYEEIRHTESAENLHLLDLQLPETGEVPDIAFDLIAEQIDFPISPASSNFATIATPTVPQEQKPVGTILLLEDEALIRQLMARRMRDKGYEVFQTENPQEAVRMARQMMANRSQFCIITDLVMPTSSGSGFLGGLEFVEAVRKINTRIPILVMTDYEDARAQTRAYTLGVFDFHKKPIFSRSSVEETGMKTCSFTDTLLVALSQPPYSLEQKQSESDFWADLKSNDKSSEPRSASHMMRQMTELQRAFSDFSNGARPAPEISHLILRYAADFFERGLLFQIKKEEVVGISGFGETGDIESMPQKARRMRISLQEESIFAKVLRERHAHMGKLADTPLNRQFISLTGRLIPPAIAMLPLLCRNSVIGFFYADNALSRKPAKDLEALEIFLAQAGLAMEHAALRRKVKSITFK